MSSGRKHSNNTVGIYIIIMELVGFLATVLFHQRERETYIMSLLLSC